ncbi:hypothetical protein [Candidatus Frankia alpina]|uniref:hypothetical protein n=1 Tax=Candidatus Frankia alpina TaxID=2699483 RepID=UPI0013D82C00|nr:hypothetical protein [Candidatus Frankia alpina]
MPTDSADAVERWQRAFEARDSAAAAAACLAEDAVVIDAIEFHTVVADPARRTRALFYRGRCGRQEFPPLRDYKIINAVDVIRHGTESAARGMSGNI